MRHRANPDIFVCVRCLVVVFSLGHQLAQAIYLLLIVFIITQFFELSLLLLLI